jgi:hypothetical protein
MHGAEAWNWQLTRSNGQAATLSDVVVLTTLPRTTPSSPSRAISRATRSRAILKPLRLSCSQTFFAP